jgi:hypothetical protein
MRTASRRASKLLQPVQAKPLPGGSVICARSATMMGERPKNKQRAKEFDSAQQITSRPAMRLKERKPSRKSLAAFSTEAHEEDRNLVRLALGFICEIRVGARRFSVHA